MDDMKQSGDCREAVIRVFGQLRGRNVSERFAFETAESVFLYHHPKASKADASKAVADWIAGGGLPRETVA